MASTEEVLGAKLAGMHPAAFNRLVERLLWHLGFTDVSNIDGAGDGGADLLANRGGKRWVFQAKSKKSGAVGVDAVNEVLNGLQLYNADRGVVVTNSRFGAAASKRVTQIEQSTGLKVGLWAREELVALADSDQCLERFSTPDLRPYQAEAFQAAKFDMEREGKAFLVLATGLGKTVIAGTIIDWIFTENSNARVLVLAHTRDLVDQLERALWRHLPRQIPTQQLQGSEKPENLPGLTVATIQTAITYVRNGLRPDLIFVDEAHHTGKTSQLGEALKLCPEALRLGATATPWRGDEFDVAEFFGPASYKIGIEEGMRLGYLVDVDYRLFVDNIDWDYVSAVSENSYSVGELNQKLFLPQRDEQIRDQLLEAWYRTPDPRAIVFCRTIDHAERMLEVLRGVPQWYNAAAVHSKMGKRDQTTNLAKFRLGDIPLLIAVDVLNEGVDVPDVNIVCFARVTHSRRIFIQQLGRGLRISAGKDRVIVLDFVSDLKRAKAVLDLRAAVGDDTEHLVLPSSHSITFSDARAESLLEQWLYDAADLESAADETRLNFPPFVDD